jgi:tRNA-Thr(GGU) m(6)t(6)A37 methyltransferase TsaA
MELRPVGYVKSRIAETFDMPPEGVRAQIEINKEYELALSGIEKSSHLIVLYWMSGAKRDVLKAKPKKISEFLPAQGVFALRSPSRPNPVGLSVVKLIQRNGLTLNVEDLDAVDGTPVLDIKPYSHGLDCFLSARRSDEYLVLSSMDREKALNRMLKEASNFHGEVCVGLAIGTRVAYAAVKALKQSLKDKNVKVVCRTRGCIADAIQALSAATNKRFAHEPGDGEITFSTGTKSVTFQVSREKIYSVDEALNIEDSDLFHLK